MFAPAVDTVTAIAPEVEAVGSWLHPELKMIENPRRIAVKSQLITRLIGVNRARHEGWEGSDKSVGDEYRTPSIPITAICQRSRGM